MNIVGVPMLLDEQPAFELGLVSDYSQVELANLAASRRLLDRLDWWLVEDWAASDAFVAAGQAGKLLGAMLAAPALLDNIDHLASARSDVAWLSWCAIRDNVSATPLIRRLVEVCSSALQQAGVRRLMCLVQSVHWLTPHLRDLGFRRVDEVVTLVLRQTDWRADAPALRSPAAIYIRPAQASDMPAVLAVDNSAFEAPWRMSMQAFVRAWRVASVLLVAEYAGQVAGYVLATRLGNDAHIARLAVRPDQQGRGIGSALLHSALSRLLDDGAVQNVTLNTQASNAISLGLYRRFGFRPIRLRLRVMCLDLEGASRAPQTVGRLAGCHRYEERLDQEESARRG